MDLELRDIYWLAGLLEGEGCFDQATQSINPRIRLRMTDKDVVRLAHNKLRCTSKMLSEKPARHGWKPSFSLACDGTLAASWMMMLWPLMGFRRQAKIRALLLRGKTQPRRRSKLGIRSRIGGVMNPEWVRRYHREVRQPRRDATNQ